MSLLNRTRQVIAACMLLLLCTVSHVRAQDEVPDYLIEVVIFETLAGQSLGAGGLYYPRVENSLRLGSEAAVAQGFISVEQNLQLSENAAAIAASSRYRLLRHISWRQPGLDENEAKAVRVALGEAIPMFLPDDLRSYEEFFPGSTNLLPDYPKSINTTTVNGTIKVRLGRFLHMEARLAYTDESTGQSFRLAQSRKMRSGELHYIDNPRFGILTKITPLEDKFGTANVDESADGVVTAPQ